MTDPENQAHISDRDLAELAALADDNLSPRRRARIEARVAESPQLTALLEEQRHGAAALQSVDVHAPDSLRRRVEAERAEVRRRRPGGLTLPARPALAGGLVAAVAAIALVVALTLPGGAGGPSVVQAAELATRPAQSGAPPPAPGQPKLLDAEVEGVSFPDWTAKFGWRAVGRRTDELGGRQAQTVFYRSPKGRLGYTILSGDQIDPPGGARSAVREGTRLRYFRDGDRLIVTWPRGGRTCVLSGSGVPLAKMLDLAGWKGQGAVSF
jgi:hypothetical protein